ncbi:hypothetical protein HCG46_26270 [Labrenzia sp. PO1]|uniref:hypothetical protein n=1 Tax=Labrenzia sp. PO1 TaxID=2720390 RepID=UPI0014476AFD|nr:hypothetical protein [Labrenzia sp. PO1]NKI61808.1 hypothetical protein [Labrenzia sp. PO1]
MLAVAKIAVLQKAVEGDLLTAAEEDTLRECVEDYRRRLPLGNGFKLTTADVAEAFEILFDDVQFMTGSRRQRVIRLLIKTGAKGYQIGSLPVRREHPTDEHIAEDFRVPVTPDEIRKAS